MRVYSESAVVIKCTVVYCELIPGTDVSVGRKIMVDYENMLTD